MKDNAKPIVISGNAILAGISGCLSGASAAACAIMLASGQYLYAGLALTAFAGWLCAADLYRERNRTGEAALPAEEDA